MQHVDTDLPQLEPEALGEDPGEGLGGGVDADVGVAEVAGRGADDEDAAAAACGEPGAELPAEFERAGDVEIDDGLDPGEVRLDEAAAVGVRARVEDEQAEVEVGDGLDDPGGRVRVEQVQGEHAARDPVRPDPVGGLPERRGLAGDEHDAQAGPGQLLGERGADPLGTADDQGPGPVALEQSGGGLAHATRSVAVAGSSNQSHSQGVMVARGPVNSGVAVPASAVGGAAGGSAARARANSTGSASR